jgi:predicted component of type VI protein secretion system
MAVLIGMSAEVKGRNFELIKEKISIGRNATNMIVLEHPSVSGRHCSITHVNNRFILADMGSTNGTRVNQKDIKDEIELRPKDLVQIGVLEFMFDSETTGESVAEAPLLKAEVEETEGPATAPVSFESISPYGPRSQQNNALWVGLIVMIGLLAVVLVVALFFILFRT